MARPQFFLALQVLKLFFSGACLDEQCPLAVPFLLVSALLYFCLNRNDLISVRGGGGGGGGIIYGRGCAAGTSKTSPIHINFQTDKAYLFNCSINCSTYFSGTSLNCSIKEVTPPPPPPPPTTNPPEDLRKGKWNTIFL